MIDKKTNYVAPLMTEICVKPTQILALSTPEVHTSGTKASTSYDALGREDEGLWGD